jgi:hypothetical protein
LGRKGFIRISISPVGTYEIVCINPDVNELSLIAGYLKSTELRDKEL